MSTEYHVDRKWSDVWLPLIRRLIGPNLLRAAPEWIDQNQAGDLVTLTAKNLSIACRVRRYSFSSFKDQFTLRTKRDSGAKTEYEKVTDGFGDWMFYGISNEKEDGFSSWQLIDLNSFRAHLIRNASALRTGEIRNPDGTSFRWFDLTSFPPNPPIIIASAETKKAAHVAA